MPPDHGKATGLVFVAEKLVLENVRSQHAAARLKNGLRVPKRAT